MAKPQVGERQTAPLGGPQRVEPDLNAVHDDVVVPKRKNLQVRVEGRDAARVEALARAKGMTEPQLLKAAVFAYLDDAERNIAKLRDEIRARYEAAAQEELAALDALAAGADERAGDSEGDADDPTTTALEELIAKEASSGEGPAPSTTASSVASDSQQSSGR